MYKFKLNAVLCISCGICTDVCIPKALKMNYACSGQVEGKSYIYMMFNSTSNVEQPAAQLMSFPYGSGMEKCTGCFSCVQECPVSAIDIY